MIFESDTIDHDRYIKEVLPVTLKYGNDMFGDDWTFQQDGTKAHIHEKSQECCVRNFHPFIDKDYWPPNSPDLNPMDYCDWKEIAQVIKWNAVTSKKTLIVTLKRVVKKISSLKVACLGPIDYIECTTTKEIILNNKIQYFCRKLKGEFFKKNIRSKDWKLTETIEKK